MKKQFERFLLELRVVSDGLDEVDLRGLIDCLATAPRIFVSGMGRSGYVMRAFATRLAQVGLAAHVVLEAGAPEFRDRDVLLVGSGSGATETVLAVVEGAKKKGAVVALVSANALSPMGRLADHRLLIPPMLPEAMPASEEVLTPMQTTFEQALWLLLDAVAVELLRLRKGAGEGY